MSEHFERDVMAALRDIKSAIEKTKAELMSQITDWATAEEADLTAISGTLNALATGVTELNSQIASLQSQLSSSGTLSTADAAALAQVKAASDALVTQAAAIKVPAPAPAVPGQVVSVSATAQGTGIVTLSWPEVAGATSYVVGRSATSGGPYSIVSPAAGVPASASPTFSDSGVPVGAQFYVVTAVNAAGPGPQSAEASVTVT